MSKSDEKAITTIILFIAGIAVLAFILWLISSTIQYLSNHIFVYGLIVGLIVGIGGTIGILRLIKWWRNR
jgi:hypothetical protein